jgi:hypothetical protein
MKLRIKSVDYIPFGFQGITVLPYVLFLRGIRPSATLIRHECIHLRQQIECLWIFFFLIYGIDFLIKFIFYRDFKMAYRSIGFEREAYDNNLNADYLNTRRPFAWVKYIYEK